MERALESPEHIQRQISYAKRQIENYKGARDRARLPEKKRNYTRVTEEQQRDLERLQAAWDAWAKQYPQEAERVLKPAKPTGQAKPGEKSGPERSPNSPN